MSGISAVSVHVPWTAIFLAVHHIQVCMNSHVTSSCEQLTESGM